MDIEQITRSVTSIPEAFNAFSRLLEDLRTAGLSDGDFRTRLVNGVLHDVEYLGKNHQMMCELEIGIETPRASFRLIQSEGREGPSVCGTYDLAKRCWEAHVIVPNGKMPSWLEPFAAIVKSASGTNVESRALAYTQLIHAMVPLLSWSGFERRAIASKAGQPVHL